MHRRLPLPARREFMTSETSLRGLRCAEAAYPARMRLPAHVHDLASITIVAGGGLGELDARGRATACERGLMIVRPPGEPHANHIGVRGVVNLELELAPALLADHDVRVTRGSIAAPSVLAGLATRLRHALRARDQTRTLAVEGIALEIVALALAERRPRASAALARAHARILGEFRERLAIAELAREAGMHPVAFARAFRACYGVAPSELVRTSRITWAAEQLRRDRERSIASIAADAGFYDQSHFARAFAAQLGCSPRAYRQR